MKRFSRKFTFRLEDIVTMIVITERAIAISSRTSALNRNHCCKFCLHEGTSPVVVVFKMCVASWPGWFRTALFRAFPLSLTTGGSVSDFHNHSRNENRGGKIKINKNFNAADDRWLAADKNCGQSASCMRRHLQCIVGKTMEFSRCKDNNKRSTI